jgi:cation transport ATPase
VFVGFGALIALRSSGPGETFDVLWIEMVVWVAIAVVVIAIAPVAVSGFGITGHALWLACSVLALLVFFGGDEMIVRTSRERRAFLSAAPIRRRWKGELAVGVLTSIPATLAFALVILGVLPEQEAALYFLAAALTLLLAALLLLQAVFGVGYVVWGVPRTGDGADAPSAAPGPAAGGGA